MKFDLFKSVTLNLFQGLTCSATSKIKMLIQVRHDAWVLEAAE